MGNKNIERVIYFVLFSVLIVLSFFIIRPFISAILLAIIAAYIFCPVYKWLLRRIKNRNISALIVTFIPLAVILTIVWFSLGIIIREAFDFYRKIQNFNLLNLAQEFLTKLFRFDIGMARQITISLQRGLIQASTMITKRTGDIIANTPQLLIQAFIVFFVMFFIIRDYDKIAKSIKKILFFNKKIEKKVMQKTNDITRGVVYGRLIVGLIQGLVAGLGFYLFKIDHAFLFTVLAIFFSILPFIGPWLIWMPASLNLIVSNKMAMGIGLFFYGAIAISWIDNLIGPAIVGRKAKINSGIALIGMLGGMYFMGIVGLVIGPLILEYLLLAINLYRYYTGKDKKL